MTLCYLNQDSTLKMQHIFAMEYYSAIKKKGILPCAKIWMNLEGIMPGEINQTKRYGMISLKSKNKNS